METGSSRFTTHPREPRFGSSRRRIGLRRACCCPRSIEQVKNAFIVFSAMIVGVGLVYLVIAILPFLIAMAFIGLDLLDDCQSHHRRISMTSEPTGDLRELEARLRTVSGAWSHYQLRLWQQCRSFDSAGIDDRIRVAKEVLAATHRGEWIWALGGWHMLFAEIQSKLDDPDPHIRGEAAIALADIGPRASRTIPLFLERLRSTNTTFHDRACAAWALPRIGVDGQAADNFGCILDAKLDPWIVREKPLSDLDELLLILDRDQPGVLIHARKQPCGSDSRAGADFKKVTAGF